jgi:hypothetical protein
VVRIPSLFPCHGGNKALHATPQGRERSEIVAIDVKKLQHHHRTLIVDRALQTKDMDNLRFLQKIRDRLDR